MREDEEVEVDGSLEEDDINEDDVRSVERVMMECDESIDVDVKDDAEDPP